MGRGIAQVCAAAGVAADLYDSVPGAAQAAAGKIAAALGESSGGEVDAHDEKGEWLMRADFVIEAVSENLDAKTALFRETEPLIREDIPFVSNTSSYRIASLAEAAKQPERVAGMHFMNPPPRMKLVEVIAAPQTSAATLAAVEDLARALGKETVRSADSPGFITNRLLFGLLNEAFCALHDGTGGAEDIDRAMTLGMNHPMGPLTLADFIGLDTCLAILETLHEGFGGKFEPCPLLRTMVEEGNLGRKSGQGFYEYDEKGKRK